MQNGIININNYNINILPSCIIICMRTRAIVFADLVAPAFQDIHENLVVIMEEDFLNAW